MAELKRQPIRFGIFEVDLQAGELRKRGLKVQLQQQPFQVLAMLLECPGEVVTREEIHKRLWPTDTFVDFDRGLNRATNRLRESIGDEAGNPRFIETLPRRGYRFIGQIERLDGGRNTVELVSGQDDAVSTNRSRHLPSFGRARPRIGFTFAIIILGLLALAVWFFFLRPRDGAIQSVAVLPFINASSDSNAEYLSDGITESLINNLSQLPNLRVMARSTVFRYKGKDIDPQKIGNDLRVQAVLSGRLLQQGNVLVIHAELMDVKTGTQLWGGQFNRGVEDVLALQYDLSSEIAEKLRLKLTGNEKQRLAKRYTEDAEAYQFYLKGRYYWNKRSPEGTRKAVSYFQQAIDKDPSYALAYAGLADAYTYLSFFNLAPPRDAMPRGKAAATKALEIDEHLAEAHVSLGYISFAYDWDWSAARKHFDQALALNPTLTRAHNFYPLYLSSRGMAQQALAVAKAALDLDPASPSVSHYLALQLYLARQFDQAIEQCHKTLDLDPNFAIAYQVLGQAYLAEGMNREAEPVLEKYSALSQGSADSLALLGYSHARLGERNQALRTLDELKATSKKSYVPAFYFAMIYAALEDKNQAFMQLEKGYDERFTRFAYLKLEALWDPVRSDERFSDLVRRVGIPPQAPPRSSD
jgi:TolB-like protein/DNA-binding winged helix-turn-helix (wHTH) protein/Tfp pilus assembly protein PilF